MTQLYNSFMWLFFFWQVIHFFRGGTPLFLPEIKNLTTRQNFIKETKETNHEERDDSIRNKYPTKTKLKESKQRGHTHSPTMKNKPRPPANKTKGKLQHNLGNPKAKESRRKPSYEKSYISIE